MLLNDVNDRRKFNGKK